jgi:hypothetical protein
MRKNLATAAALALAGLALTGIGAGASFTDSVTANQELESGTIGLTVHRVGTTTVAGDTATCAASANLGSTAKSICAVQLSNTGTLPIRAISVDVDAGPLDTMDATLPTIIVNNPAPPNTAMRTLFPAQKLGTVAAARGATTRVIPLSSPLEVGEQLRLTSVVDWSGLDDTQQGKVLQNLLTITAADVTTG